MNRKTKKIELCIFLCFATFSYAQKVIDQAYIKCSYHYTELQDTVSRNVLDDYPILRIGERVSKFYSPKTYSNDSLLMTPDGNRKSREELSEAIKIYQATGNDNLITAHVHGTIKYYIYKGYPQNETLTLIDRIVDNFYQYEETGYNQLWEMKDSTKTILGYECQKAECEFRGRHWTAWFASEVPVSNGPWKFGGLPGLIMEVYDRGRQYVFTINGLQKTTESITFTMDKQLFRNLEKVERKKMNKMLMNFRRNENSINTAMTGIDFDSGNTSKQLNYDFIERDYW